VLKAALKFFSLEDNFFLNIKLNRCYCVAGAPPQAEDMGGTAGLMKLRV
jgi:hypothetical protein